MVKLKEIKLEEFSEKVKMEIGSVEFEKAGKAVSEYYSKNQNRESRIAIKDCSDTIKNTIENKELLILGVRSDRKGSLYYVGLDVVKRDIVSVDSAKPLSPSLVFIQKGRMTARSVLVPLGEILIKDPKIDIFTECQRNKDFFATINELEGENTHKIIKFKANLVEQLPESFEKDSAGNNKPKDFLPVIETEGEGANAKYFVNIKLTSNTENVNLYLQLKHIPIEFFYGIICEDDVGKTTAEIENLLHEKEFISSVFVSKITSATKDAKVINSVTAYGNCLIGGE